MNYRALVFDDQKEIRRILWSLFDGRGYEVFTFPHPALCPLSEKKHCPCPKDQACSDVIMSDVEMPFINGMDFIEEQIHKGCRCDNIALMSGAFKNEHFEKAKLLGITIFKKPFRIKEIENWLDRIEENIAPERKLADWYLERIQNKNDGS
jgi:DNA-binding NtrC family response regulator